MWYASPAAGLAPHSLNVRHIKTVMNAARYSLILLAPLLCALRAQCESPRYSNYATTSIRYELSIQTNDQPDKATTQRPSGPLRIYLTIKNTHDSDLIWVGKSVFDIDAQLVDENGHPVKSPPTVASIQDSDQVMCIPYGSTLDWMISHSGISMIGDLENNVAVVVGGKGWLIPIESMGKHSLKISVRGLPAWARHANTSNITYRALLFDTPFTPIIAEQAAGAYRVEPASQKQHTEQLPHAEAQP